MGALVGKIINFVCKRKNLGPPRLDDLKHVMIIGNLHNLLVLKVL